MRNAMLKFFAAALIAVSAVYLGLSNSSARGDMMGTGPMTGMMDGTGGMTGGTKIQ